MQTKKQSLIESITNVFLGFVITLVFSPIIYNICGITVNPAQIGGATILFTILSVIRSYVVRRWFNK